MAFSGKQQANDVNDLYSKIVAYLTGDDTTAGRDWEVVHNNAQDKQVILKSTGLGGLDQIYIGLQVFIDPSGAKAQIGCRVYKYWQNGMNFLDEVHAPSIIYPTNHKVITSIPLHNAPVNYFLWSNKQRIVLIVKTAGLYACAYLGMFHRFLTPSEYPYPLLCYADGWFSTGSPWTSGRFTSHSTNSRRKCVLGLDRAFGQYQDPEDEKTRQVCNVDGVWEWDFHLYPTRNSTYYGQKPVVYENSQDKVLFPVYVSTARDVPLGQLDGVYWCPASNNTLEEVIDNKYTLFPDINRIEWFRWFAVGEE